MRRTLRAIGRKLPTTAALLAGLSLIGCVGGGFGQQGPTAAERLERTIGQNERDVIGRWGPPDDFYEFADGGRTLTWEYGYWQDAWQEQWYCAITLETDNRGTIVDWQYEYDYDAANPCHDIMDGVS